MKETISFLLLCVPLAWELYNDRKDDLNKVIDVFIRTGLVIVCAVPAWFYGHSYLSAIVLSGAIFFLLFDYLINIIMLRRKDFFSYLGTTSKIDQLKFWKGLKPWHRFYIRAGVFIGSLVWYVLG